MKTRKIARVVKIELLRRKIRLSTLRSTLPRVKLRVKKVIAQGVDQVTKKGKIWNRMAPTKTSTFGDDRGGVESLFSDRSIHAPSRQSAIVSSSASSAVSFTRSLAEKIFENDDEDDEKLPRPTPRMLSSRRSSMLGGVNGYNNTA